MISRKVIIVLEEIVSISIISDLNLGYLRMTALARVSAEF